LATTELPRYLFGVEAAEYVRVNPATFYRWCKEGRVPAVKFGGRWRVAREYLDAMLAGTL
jgi:excisionase family DNA binding protein